MSQPHHGACKNQHQHKDDRSPPTADDHKVSLVLSRSIFEENEEKTVYQFSRNNVKERKRTWRTPTTGSSWSEIHGNLLGKSDIFVV